MIDGGVPGTIRDEDEQVRYRNDLLPTFEQEGFDTVFWFSFTGFELPRRPEPPKATSALRSYDGSITW
ncbi:hypothetical protein [Nonomuraea insulae]|uniref:Uncharacterized protein n=1 Tax=Nonomuraea insulae TaxID=1616787 RepID=A0ABW1CSN0_9ACTN